MVPKYIMSIGLGVSMKYLSEIADRYVGNAKVIPIVTGKN